MILTIICAPHLLRRFLCCSAVIVETDHVGRG